MVGGGGDGLLLVVLLLLVVVVVVVERSGCAAGGPGWGGILLGYRARGSRVGEKKCPFRCLLCVRIAGTRALLLRRASGGTCQADGFCSTRREGGCRG